MKTRLMFSTASSIDPDILIVDEALAVGDVRFQRKCFKQMERLRDEGKAILFVSHMTQHISSFCDRAILMEEGRVVVRAMPVPSKALLQAACSMRKRTPSVGRADLAERARGRDVKDTATVKHLSTDFVPHADEVRAGDQFAQVVDVALVNQDGRRTSISSWVMCTKWFIACTFATS